MTYHSLAASAASFALWRYRSNRDDVPCGVTRSVAIWRWLAGSVEMADRYGTSVYLARPAGFALARVARSAARHEREPAGSGNERDA